MTQKRIHVRDVSDKGSKYAIAAQKDRRATLAGEIVKFKQGIRDREEQLAHLDATLRILDPATGRDGKPLSTPEIADAIIAVKGYGHEAKHALIRRVRANLSYLLRQRGGGR
jgi:hypothetical protein